MKKRIFIALAAALSVTLAAVCTAGVMARTGAAEPVSSSSPSGKVALNPEAVQPAADASAPGLEQIRKESQQKAENVLFYPANETRKALADEMASGCPSAERLSAVAEQLKGTGFSEHAEYSFGGLHTCFGLTAEEWLHDFVLYFYDSADEKAYSGGQPKAFFDDVCEGIRARYEGITEQQVRTIFLRRLFGVSGPYSEAVLVGLADPSAPKLTPETAKAIIGASDGTVEDILEEFRAVQPYADVGETIEDLRKEKALVVQSDNIRETTPRFGRSYQFVTQDADGVYHSVIVGDLNAVYYQQYDSTGRLLSSECLVQPNGPADPLAEGKDLRLSDFSSDSTWGGKEES